MPPLTRHCLIRYAAAIHACRRYAAAVYKCTGGLAAWLRAADTPYASFRAMFALRRLLRVAVLMPPFSFHAGFRATFRLLLMPLPIAATLVSRRFSIAVIDAADARSAQRKRVCYMRASAYAARAQSAYARSARAACDACRAIRKTITAPDY